MIAYDGIVKQRAMQHHFYDVLMALVTVSCCVDRQKAAVRSEGGCCSHIFVRCSGWVRRKRDGEMCEITQKCLEINLSSEWC